MSVQWLPWGAEAFARAARERRPVLLSISATWCHWCHEMDRTSYSDPLVVSLITNRFVPVRVDADERPDINERYNLGGWPTTAFLTAEGDVICGGTYVPIERMASVLEQVAGAFAERGDEITARAVLRQGAGQAVRQGSGQAPQEYAEEHRSAPSTPSLDELSDLVFRHFDPEYGGFGSEPKFPHAAPVLLALDLFQERGDAAMRDLAVNTLDAMGWGGLYDEIDGGFFRYASTRGWQLPHYEKLLSVNAAMLSLYVTAAEVLQLSRFRERAHDVLRYVQTWLADTVDGGWFASQRADFEYYGTSSRDQRQARTPPPVDERLYTDWNGAMVSAALHAARAAEDEGLRDFAIKSLERVVLASYRPGEGVAHWFDGQPHVRGLLEDQIAMAAAHLDAYEATDNIVYEMMAEELAHYAVRTMWDESGGGFFDRAADQDSDPAAIGLLRRRVKPFVANCDAASLLYRLASSSGDHDFRARADATLEAIAPVAAAQGPLAAHYVLAVRRARQR
jgi:uncharacterized protein YyaL (SSP411 family)